MSEGINMRLAADAVAWCRANGVAEVVLCSGARNLSLVATWLDAPGIRHWHFPEERSAAFFALGRILAGAGPVAVVVTSGTAVAELLPATIEAYYQGLPLLLMTADRPRHFRGSAAPQAIAQRGIFGPYAQPLADLAPGDPWPEMAWARTGPGHLNLCFGEPVLDGTVVFSKITAKTPPPPASAPCHGASCRAWDDFGAGQRLLVMAGKLAPDELGPVRRFLVQLQAPVWLETTSNLWGSNDLKALWTRNTENAIPAGVTHVLRLGGVPCDRLWRDLEELPEIAVRSISRQGWSGLGRSSEAWQMDLKEAGAWCPAPSLGTSWLPTADGLAPDIIASAKACSGRGKTLPVLPGWAYAGNPKARPGRSCHVEEAALGRQSCSPLGHDAPESRAAKNDVISVKNPSRPLTEKEWVRQLSCLIPGGSAVFLGNSLPIREWQEYGDWRQGLTFHANRGANGIDGEIATFLGLAASAAEAWGIFGDLTVLYDLAAPWVLRQMRENKLRLVVLNNGGGAIFSRLPALAGASGEVLQVLLNRHALNFSGWAALWEVPYLQARCATDLETLPDGPAIMEILPGDGISGKFPP